MQFSHNLLAKAIDSLREGVTISDAKMPDNPLVYVNQAFLRMTGYQSIDVIGKNCRYLQGVGTDLETVNDISKSIKNKSPLVVEILNYTKFGIPFWNQLSISPLFDDKGEVTHFVGIQDDITRVKIEREEKSKRDQQFVTSQALLQGEETERNRLGLELHDNVSQLLGTIKLFLGLAEDPARREEGIREGKSLINLAIQEVRNLSHRMVTPSTTENEFVDALDELFNNMKLAGSFNLKVHYESRNLPISDDAKLAVFRILQEHFNNVIKYAAAKRIDIDFKHLTGRLEIVVTEDGVGFEPSKKKSGIGLKNMEARAQMINATLDLQSKTGQGTRLAISIPLVLPNQ